MSRFVLDASVVLTWCFSDEASQKAAEISERFAAGDRAIVTPFWRHEVLSAILIGEKRKRLARDLTAAFIEDLNRLPLSTIFPIESSRLLTCHDRFDLDLNSGGHI